MFGYNYRYQMDSTKNIIKLAPTKGTYAKALLPSLLMGGGVMVMAAVGYHKEQQQILAHEANLKS